MIKTLRRCKWEEIKVGEVFAINGCWWIFYKHSKNRYAPLADTYLSEHYYRNGYVSKNSSDFFIAYENDIYKLPKSFQRNFIDWGER